MAGSGAAVFFVTGKGGVGKTTVAETLARGAAAGGLRTVLIRTEASGGTPHQAPYRRLDIEPRRALRDFLTGVLRFRFITDRLLDSATFSAVAAAAPGLADLVTLNAVAEAAETDCDVVIVDAPASGHSVPLLASPSRVLDLIGVGPVARTARRAQNLVCDSSRCRAVTVTLAEELAVGETLALMSDLSRLGVALGPCLVNGVYPLAAEPAQGAWIVRERASADASLYLRTRERQVAFARELQNAGTETIELPFSFAGLAPDDTQAKKLLTRVMEASA